jgi:hypothetical protein
MHHYSSLIAVPSRLEWQPDIERLRTEIREARKTGDFEHLAIAEAECWLDLIDAELCARRDPDDPDTRQLKRWRVEIDALLKLNVPGAATFSVAQARTS